MFLIRWTQIWEQIKRIHGTLAAPFPFFSAFFTLLPAFLPSSFLSMSPLASFPTTATLQQVTHSSHSSTFSLPLATQHDTRDSQRATTYRRRDGGTRRDAAMAVAACSDDVLGQAGGSTRITIRAAAAAAQVSARQSALLYIFFPPKSKEKKM